MIKYLTFSISIAFISWIVGIIVNTLLMKTSFYQKNLSHLNFIKSKSINKSMGLGILKWIIKNTFFRFFNQNIKLATKVERADLVKLRAEMTTSEIGHLAAFIFATFFTVPKLYNGNYVFALIIMIVNILMNLYPSLLQQQNKRRIDYLMGRFKTQPFITPRAVD